MTTIICLLSVCSAIKIQSFFDINSPVLSRMQIWRHSTAHRWGEGVYGEGEPYVFHSKMYSNT